MFNLNWIVSTMIYAYEGETIKDFQAETVQNELMDYQ